MSLQPELLRLVQQLAARHYGKYRGIVVDTDDPKSMGRIKARVPEVLGEVETGWALPVALWAGDTEGFFAVPPVDAAVWIEFEAGDPSRPLWTGSWWGEGQVPEEATPAQKVIRTTAGHLVVIDDEAGITITDKDGATIVLDENGIEISMEGTKLAITGSSLSVNDGTLEVTT